MNGKDFFKSCTTNTRMIENISDFHYLGLGSDTRLGNRSRKYEALADLRKHNILSVLVKEDLFVFAQREQRDAVDLLLQKYDTHTESHSWLAFEPDKEGSYGHRLDKVFLSALEGALSYALAREHGILQVGDFTWVFVREVEGEQAYVSQSIVMHVDAKLSSDKLYLSTSTASSNIRQFNAADIAADQTLMLAPSGRRARPVAESRGDEVVLVEPNANAGWKPNVAQAMGARGIDIGADDQWIVVEFGDEGRQERIAWPQRLCLIHTSSNILEAVVQSTGQYWSRWFSSSPLAFKNPLAEAEEWFARATERDKVMDAEMGGSVSDNMLSNSAHIVAETPLATSPPFNQRLMDQQAAMSGIYPTPPDGYMPAQIPQQPTSDAMPTDHSSLNNELQLPGSDDNALVVTSSIESNGEVQTFQPNSDDLFGDMGEMDFATNEVGDADFDYFDEPDDLPHHTTAHDVPMEDAEEAVQVKNDAESKPHEESLSSPDVITTDNISVPNSRPISRDDNEYAQLQSESAQGDELAPKLQTQFLPPESSVQEPEKPLSPWTIRRQLLPIIPASATATEAGRPQPNRHSGSFGSIAFNENLALTSKYVDHYQVEQEDDLTSSRMPSISLPQKRKKSAQKPSSDPDSGVTDLDSSSDDDSDESDTSVNNEASLPPQLSWNTKKRKRSSWHQQATLVADAADDLWPIDQGGTLASSQVESNYINDILDNLLHGTPNAKSDPVHNHALSSASSAASLTLPSAEDLFDLSKMDLVYIAQLVADQAVSAIPGIISSITNSPPPTDNKPIASALESIIRSSSDTLLPTVEDCSISNLALVKEAPARPIMASGKPSQVGQPRPLQREGSMQLGPDYFPIPPPFISVRRGSDTWEMLPPAVSFWSALGLSPTNGGKDVIPIAIVPDDMDLVGLTQDFIKKLGGVYESRKLGSFAKTADVLQALAKTNPTCDDNGCVLVSLDEEVNTLEDALKAFLEACDDLAKNLATVGHVDPDRTIVVFMIDPFEDERLKPHMAACFWKLYTAYRANIPKTHVKSPRSDLVLQLLPVSLIAAPDRLVVLDTHQLGSLAMEVYDRCPPSAKAISNLDTSALPMFAAPAVELADMPPKRILLQSNPDPPSDLLHEGSVLHLAYSLSKDMQWMTACWIDSTGRYQQSHSASLRGKSFQDVAAEVWDRTLDILTARDVTWRVLITSSSAIDASEAKCWRSIVASRPRRQMLHVTLLSLELDTPLQLSVPTPDHASNAGHSAQATSFLTPGSTPQATLTVSPDASGHTIPATPAPSDQAPANAESDPDAHLVDTADESWGMLLSPAFTSFSSHSCSNSEASSTAPVAKGILFRRGDPASNKLESIGVELRWDIRVRPNGAVDEGVAKQSEVTLREVLRMFRGLGVLGRIRGINKGVHCMEEREMEAGRGWCRCMLLLL